jgi:hypothetical protein
VGETGRAPEPNLWYWLPASMICRPSVTVSRLMSEDNLRREAYLLKERVSNFFGNFSPRSPPSGPHELGPALPWRPRATSRDRDAERLGGVVSPNSSSGRQGQSDMLCVQELPNADVPMSISAAAIYADGRHLTVRSIRWRFTAYPAAIARTSNRSSPYESTHQDSVRADDRCCP